MVRTKCVACDAYFTGKPGEVLCPRCRDESAHCSRVAHAALQNNMQAGGQMNLQLNGNLPGNTRQLLMERKQNGQLGVIAARSGIAEYVLREWCDDPMAFTSITSQELSSLQSAMDNRKR